MINNIKIITNYFNLSFFQIWNHMLIGHILLIDIYVYHIIDKIHRKIIKVVQVKMKTNKIIKLQNFILKEFN